MHPGKTVLKKSLPIWADTTGIFRIQTVRYKVVVVYLSQIFYHIVPFTVFYYTDTHRKVIFSQWSFGDLDLFKTFQFILF